MEEDHSLFTMPRKLVSRSVRLRLRIWKMPKNKRGTRMAIMAEAQMGIICFFLGRANSGYTMAPSGLKTGKLLFAAGASKINKPQYGIPVARGIHTHEHCVCLE
jgi:hypothetical protein